ncbi:hypothetical protein Kpol_1050p38 [Vanderwaltozyma polyspora DSM 70294]|uniref:Phosphoribulokinase/uridine kinase domain-containing protein n=1 Tax=Vanderwaltozyma polyspora (strain ATCC 22028 / DSM 70294 / BCRC 21397 / CBS 2163 / NBRC 10782 / NRRL Y-8283 / UCD 57-17) TaxID=436907 RepID=A7TET5_VANPO|nr:uncharacterized protein Kpol_1050p38 [Vanderwaltozyma polyspora DSM 70294]EDO19181.1 hypothetical protein Kpol_1050p38 [Vanderwaltozyma polyspora DSM 70294]
MMVHRQVIDECILFLDEHVDSWFGLGGRQPLFVFVSGPQGSGKTYNGSRIYEYLKEKFKDQKRVVYCSIDDFYLTHGDQKKLEGQFPGNQLLRGRGLPGTHDMKLLYEFIDAINCNCRIRGDGKYHQKLRLPMYDKSKYSGEGDRASECAFTELPVDIFILEGWFLGFEPVLPDSLDDERKQLLEGDMKLVNSNLYLYCDLLWNNPEIHSLGIAFDTDSVEQRVYQWRLQQEHDTIAKHGDGMSDESVMKFVDRYIPSYKLYYRDFINAENLGSIATLTLKIDSERKVLSTKMRSVD